MNTPSLHLICIWSWCFLLLIFYLTLSLHFTTRLQSAFYTDRYANKQLRLCFYVLIGHFVVLDIHQCLLCRRLSSCLFHKRTLLFSRHLIRNNTQTAVINMTIKRIVLFLLYNNAFYSHVYHRSLCVIFCRVWYFLERYNRPFAGCGRMVRNKLCWDAIYKWDF